VGKVRSLPDSGYLKGGRILQILDKDGQGWKGFRPRIIYSSEARSQSYTTQVNSGLTLKNKTRFERISGHKRSSLFGIFIRDEEKSIMTLAPASPSPSAGPASPAESDALFPFPAAALAALAAVDDNAAGLLADWELAV